MAETVTIVAYHYVRQLAQSRYPALKALELALFREQLAYIRRHYHVITAESLIAAVEQFRQFGRWELPRNAALLTFDDGYRDHYRHVFPLLSEAGVQGSFFPPAQTVCERRVLDVNKLHFVLAAGPNPRALAEDIFHRLDAHRAAYDLESNEALYARLARPSRRDPPEIVFVKRALQLALPAPVRAEIASDLFAKYVTADEACFADELYMSADELRELVQSGMYVGNHTYRHPWLAYLAPDEQAIEIDRSLEMLRTIGMDLRAWIMSYPYGNPAEANPSNGLYDLLRARGCAVGLTTQPAIATARLDPLLLPRLDANDLPKQADAAPASWTTHVI